MNKLRNSKGMTLSELLVATIIMLLVSLALTTGVALSNKEFVSSIRQSEAEELYSTINNLISNELRYTSSINATNNVVTSFQSMTFTPRNSSKSAIILLDDDGDALTYDDYGQIAIGDENNHNRILGSASYTKNLGAKVNITYTNRANHSDYFTVRLQIGVVGSNSSIIDRTFTVRALNEVSVND